MPTELLDSFDEKLKASLKRIADEGFDMDRMAMVIGRDERQVGSAAVLHALSVLIAFTASQ